MEEVRTSIEKMLDSYDSPHSNHFNNSFNSTTANGESKFLLLYIGWDQNMVKAQRLNL